MPFVSQFVSKVLDSKKRLSVKKQLGSQASSAIVLAVLVAVGYGIGRPLLGQAMADRKVSQPPVAQTMAGSLQALRAPQWAEGPNSRKAQGTKLVDQTAEPKVATSDRKIGQVLEAAYQASWYGPGFHGNLTANGEIFDQEALTAAHKELPFGTQLRITNVANGQSVVVRVNDRGPYIEGRELDLSHGAAAAIGGTSMGVIPIQMEILK